MVAGKVVALLEAGEFPFEVPACFLDHGKGKACGGAPCQVLRRIVGDRLEPR